MSEPTDSLLEAGRIAAQVREDIKNKVKPGVKVIDLCDSAERMIGDLGGKPAFPCNIDIDRVAAHYVSPLGDTTVIEQGQLVKVDIGVHIDGYIADTAVTVCLNPTLKNMVEAVEAALEAAIKTIKTGVKTSDIGAVIEHTIKNRGFKPIRNLTGHKLSRYIVHAGKSIPNIRTMLGEKLLEGEVFAVEPFTVLSTSAGEVRDGASSNIYRFDKKRNFSNTITKEMLNFIQSEYRTLPFASRWVLRRFPGSDGINAFDELIKFKSIYSYPQLIEKTNGVVAQAEHTIIVTNEGCIVTTR
ncbi:type II methionyl aminopeptidase [Candidatus Bathyarchaeota archaeon]|nr:type II methionyl aminopeptidase [Candidatus Bathyarchaeota archaeon]